MALPPALLFLFSCYSYYSFQPPTCSGNRSQTVDAEQDLMKVKRLYDFPRGSFPPLQMQECCESELWRSADTRSFGGLP